MKREYTQTEDSKSEKIAFNPHLHLLKKDVIASENNLSMRRDKRRKQIKKEIKMEKDYVMDYNDLMLENLQKEFYTTKSPHLLINRKWSRKIRKNTIMLKKVSECE